MSWIQKLRATKRWANHLELPYFHVRVKVKKWICKIFGHDLNMDVIEFYSAAYCERCGYNSMDDFDPSYMELVQAKFRRWYRERLKSFHVWWKCADCGKHFGKHDESVDHLPF